LGVILMALDQWSKDHPSADAKWPGIFRSGRWRYLPGVMFLCAIVAFGWTHLIGPGPSSDAPLHRNADQSSTSYDNHGTNNGIIGPNGTLTINGAPPPRTLSPGEVTELTEAIRATSPLGFSVVAWQSNHEASALAEQICAALRRGGWQRIEANLHSDIVARSPPCVTFSLNELPAGVRFVFDKKNVDSDAEVAWSALVGWVRSVPLLMEQTGGGRLVGLWSDRTDEIESVRIVVGPRS